MPWVVLGIVCALVIGFYAWSARPGWVGLRTAHAEDAYYNLLVRGFRAGQINLKAEVPAGLAQLADPFDSIANVKYLLADGHPLWDLSYYHGKLYLYFGVAPALVLFWPYAVLTGHYLGHKEAAVIFFATGFLASVGLLCLVWRRYFPEVGLTVVAAGTLALGLAVFTPIILPRVEPFEIAISSGYALSMMALLALWGACHRPHQRGRWLAAASLAYGLAIGSRPNLLFGAVILLVPVVQAWREGRRIWVPLLAAIGPITCIGLGLLLYNTLRFDNPLEFGTHYQLSSNDNSVSCWSPHFLGFNSWVYFLAPARWRLHFPFVFDIKLTPLPIGHGGNEHPFGLLMNIPLVWLAVAAPLVWRGRSAEERWLLRGFLGALALLFATVALTLCFFRACHARYEMDFCPALILLAVVGILGVEHTLAGRPAWRWAARGVWGLLVAFSLAFSLMASAIYHAEYHFELGCLVLERGQVNEAIAQLQRAVELRPDDHTTHYNLGVALDANGQTDEAIRQYREALRLESRYVDAHNNLGADLDKQGQIDEAIRQYLEAISLKPEYADAHNNLGAALDEKGQSDEAIRQYREAVRLKPDHADARNNLGLALGKKGQTGEAISHLQEAIRLKPDYADAHYNLGVAFYQAGRIAEAIRQYEEALKLKPDFVAARKNLEAVRGSKANSSPPSGTTTNR
jgi:Flp pilus assembly protein TadD